MTEKAKDTPAHQGKFPPPLPSSSASASAAHPVKGRFALRSASLHSALDLLPRLRPSLLTTAAPREISPQGAMGEKAGKAEGSPPCPPSGGKTRASQSARKRSLHKCALRYFHREKRSAEWCRMRCVLHVPSCQAKPPTQSTRLSFLSATPWGEISLGATFAAE